MDKKLINNKRKEIISRVNIYVFGNCYIYICNNNFFKRIVFL